VIGERRDVRVLKYGVHIVPAHITVPSSTHTQTQERQHAIYKHLSTHISEEHTIESHLIHYIYINTCRLRFNDSGQYGRTTGSTDVLMNTALHGDIGLTHLC
jgi:hypothetical protein